MLNVMDLNLLRMQVQIEQRRLGGDQLVRQMRQLQMMRILLERLDGARTGIVLELFVFQVREPNESDAFRNSWEISGQIG